MSQVWGIISVPYADVSLGSQNRGSTRKCLSPLGRKSFWLSSSDCKIYEDEETLLEKLYLEGGATWVNKVELLRQYGTMRGNQSMIFLKSQATWANQPVADNSLIWQRLAPKHLLARLTRTLSNSGVKQSRQALPGWAKSSVKRRRRTSFIEFSERTEV